MYNYVQIMSSAGLNRFRTYLSTAGLDEKSYQVEGVDWCLKKELGEVPATEGVKGGIIADEMGLGKTIVMSGLIVSNFVKHTLIVLPLSLVDQWAGVFTDTMNHTPLVYHGTNKQDITSEDLSKAPIVLTTYGHIAMTNLLHAQKWNRIIFDEAHHLRNVGTAIHRGAATLMGDAKWLVSGTPIQNRFSDFQALCIIMGLSPKYAMSLDNVPEIVQNYMLRRRKDEVGLELPMLNRYTEEVAWENESEKKLAEDIHSHLQFSNVAEHKVDSQTVGLDNTVLAILTRARQLCIYPPMLDSHTEKLVNMGLFENAAICHAALSHSSKMNAVEKKVKERKDNQCGKLIFCHYRAEIDEVARRLSALGMNVETFDGRTSHTKRAKILGGVCDALILQIKTGCEGLNLQQFSEIYFVSPHWNPAIEDQAVARCHRIGQSKPIDVFRFQMQGFDEEAITISLDIHSNNVQHAKRETSRSLDTVVDETKTTAKTKPKKKIKIQFTDMDELKNVAKHKKTQEGYLKDGFVED
jgi:SNF2 family DNA or RNA helicase